MERFRMSLTVTNDTPRSSLGLRVFVSPTHVIGGDPNRTFSPTTATLIFGATDAVLVDALMITEDIDALGDMIASTGKRLTTIFITHGHGDHFFGSERLIARFPGARVVTTRGIVDYIDSHFDEATKTFTAYFRDSITKTTLRPSPLEGDVVVLEGHELRVVEVPGGDIAPAAVLHIPALDAVVAGDVAYNQIHQMLALGGPAEWDKWIESVGIIERLRPRIVVAGHKKPEARDDEADRILSTTRTYIRDFAEAFRSSATADEIVAAMRSKYPDHGNLTTLMFSAREAVKARTK
jgi:glyoxylase-like metal-dependent hydrolase (beta-lactamase superfamily II)